MRSTDAVTTAPAYDEFGLFHENAEEFGIELQGRPDRAPGRGRGRRRRS